MTRRYALRDDQWERIEGLLPGREDPVGVTAKDNRLFVEAILYRYRVGIPRTRIGAQTGPASFAGQETLMALSSPEAGRELAAARQLKEKRCPICGKDFMTVGRGVYCSNACKQRAKYQRKSAVCPHHHE